MLRIARGVGWERGWTETECGDGKKDEMRGVMGNDTKWQLEDWRVNDQRRSGDKGDRAGHPQRTVSRDSFIQEFQTQDGTSLLRLVFQRSRCERV